MSIVNKKLMRQITSEYIFKYLNLNMGKNQLSEKNDLKIKFLPFISQTSKKIDKKGNFDCRLSLF